MAEQTGISWCDATFNPWVGCTKVSPGCKHCYAETLVTGRMGRPETWGPSGTRERTSESNWTKPIRWNRMAAEGLLPDGTSSYGLHRPRIFCASLADVFEPLAVLDPWRLDLFDLIAATPNLDWLVLTKRPDFAAGWLRNWWDERRPLSMESRGGAGVWEADGRAWASRDYLGWGVLPNLWIGASIESTAYTWRGDYLRLIPAPVRFISAEPLLGSLFQDSRPLDRTDPAGVTAADDATERGTDTRGRAPLDLTGIDWCIVGGESGGRNARPMHPDWARELRDACPRCPRCDRELEDAGGYLRCPADFYDGGGRLSRPAFHFKQHGSWAPSDALRADIALEPDGALRAASDALSSPRTAFMRFAGAGPKSGGKLLDGVDHCEFPPSAPVLAHA